LVSGERLSTAALAAEVVLVVTATLPMSRAQIAKIGMARNLFIIFSSFV
jgi:hypothetical protein